MVVSNRTTVAISLLVHGEAVRFNRGKTRGGDFDFKYLQGSDGRKYPYVSSQCFKKYWRESLPGDPSPIIRGKNSKGEEKNQAFTSGNPFIFEDDDLFGYMIAGADNEEAEAAADEETDVQGVDQLDEVVEALMFRPEDIKSPKALLAKIRDGSAPSQYLLELLDSEDREIAASLEVVDERPDEALRVTVEVLNRGVGDTKLYSEARFPRATAAQKKTAVSGKIDEIYGLNRELLQKMFGKEIEPKKKRPTTRRTAPIRMHALVAFSDIKTASDFQTFSRDVALSGKNSILNPNPVGIYSGWLKTRILIEAHRIGKFYIGGNLDILDDLTPGHEVQSEIDPYSRTKDKVSFVQLDESVKRERLQHALEGLANLGNRQGPASGALHDGSLKPKGFVAALMNCADSPFDSVWVDAGKHPVLDLHRLKAVLQDWSDLFASQRIYVGLPIESTSTGDEGQLQASIEKAIRDAGFEPAVGTPRKMLVTLAQEAAG